MSNIYSWGNPESEDEELGSTLGREKMMEALRGNASADLASRVAEIYRENPWMDPGVVLSLAKAQANFTSVAGVSGLSLNYAEDRKEKVQGGDGEDWFKRNVRDNIGSGGLGKVFNGLKWGGGKLLQGTGKVLQFITPDAIAKPIVKWTTAAAQTAVELVQNSPRIVTGRPVDKENGTWGFGEYKGRAGWFASTTLGQMLSGKDSGSGYLPGEEVRAAQSEKARQYRGTMPEGSAFGGSAYSFGRGMAYNLDLEGDAARYVSGFFDATVTLAVSRGTTFKSVKGYTQAVRGTENIVSRAGNAQNLLGAVFKGAGEGQMSSLDVADDFMKWATTNKHARRLIKRMAEETSPSKIMEMFDDKITIEDAERIARATTEEQQIAFMQQLFSRERLSEDALNQIKDLYTAADGTFNETAYDRLLKRGLMTTDQGVLVDKIKDLPGARAQLLSSKIGETKLYRWLDKWTSVAPSGTILVLGDSRQRSSAVKNLRNYLKTLGGARVYMTERDDILAAVENLRTKVIATTGEAASEPGIMAATAELESGAALVARSLDEAEDGMLSYRGMSKARSGVKRMRDAANRIAVETGKPIPSMEILSETYALEKRVMAASTNLNQTRLDSILDRFMRAASDGSRQKMYRSRAEIEEVIRETLRYNGFDEARIEVFMKTVGDGEDQLRLWWQDEVGSMSGQGAARAFYDSGLIDAKTVDQLVANPTMIDDVGLVGPTVMSDLLNSAIFLPDPRQVRAYNNPFWKRAMLAEADNTLVKGAVATERALVKGSDFLVNRVWKRMALMTIGYIFRNVMDGQIRVALLGKKVTGMSGLLNHPIDYIAWAIRNSRGKGGIIGQSWDEVRDAYLAASGVETLEDAASQDLYEAFGRSGHRQVVDPVDADARLARTNSAVVVDRASAGADSAHTTGVVDALGQINSDITMRMAVQGVPTEDFLRIIKSKQNRKILRSIKDLLADGFYFNNPQGMRVRVPIDVSTNAKLDEALTIWYENVVIPRVRPYMGQGREAARLRFAALHDTVLTPSPLSGSGRTTYAELVDPNGSYGPLLEGVDVKIGTVIPTAGTIDGMRHNLVVTDITPHPIINDVTGEVIEAEYITLDSAFPGGAFGGEGLRGTPSLRSAVDDAARLNQTPQRVRYVLRQADLTPTQQDDVTKAARWLVNGFFGNVSERAMRRLEKYPFWRQGYYHVVRENVDMLKPSEARKALENIKRAAEREGMSAEQYIGGTVSGRAGFDKYLPERLRSEENVIARLERQAALPDDGTLTGTVEDLNAYAGEITNMNMANIFFESAQRNNIEDALRVVYPFGAAWREVLGKYLKLAIEDPYRVRKAELIYRGGINADPDGDGRGILYKDPQSGQVMFVFPGSKFVANAMQKVFTSGPTVDVSMEAPLRQLNVGFNTLPAMGPIVQIPAAILLKDKPQMSELMQIIAPYGSPSTFKDGVFNAAMPGWMNKAYQAFSANTDDMDTMFAQTYVDTARALSTSGEYDLTNQNEVDMLLKDAKSKARAIMGLRALTQFIGPTSGSPSYQVKDAEGRDIYVDILAQELATLREQDYDTAVSKFLNAHGENFMLYLASKTRATDKGQGYEPTQEFLAWSIENKTFLDKYRKTGAFFGPTSDEFSFAAWDYQIATGKRIYNDPREIIQQSQYVVGSESYRQERLKYGPYPNTLERERLRSVRVALNQRYPGYPVNPVFEVNEFESLFIPELKKAVEDKTVAGYEVTDFIKAYLDARDNAIASIGGGSLKSSKKSARARAALAYYGQQLSNENNEFARLYDRHLAAEVED